MQEDNKPLNLAQFTGSDVLHIHHFLKYKIKITQGVLYLAENAGCFWLIDAICSHQGNPAVQAEAFQVWILEKRKPKKNREDWTLYMHDGNYNIIVRQRIQFSDFPLGKMHLWFVENTLMLPTEY